MTKTITQNDLVRFVYQETDREDNKIILDALLEQSWVEQEIHQLLDVKNALDFLKEEPSEGCVERILDAVKGEMEGI